MLPARHEMQQHLSCSAAASAGACAGSQGLFAPRALPGQLEPVVLLLLWNRPNPVPIVPFLFVPWVHFLVHPCLCCICPSPGVGRSLPGRAMPSPLCRAGTCPMAMVLLHLRA